MNEATTTTTKEYCANHPTVETTLHCNRCEKPICTRCAVLTPTGYRCKECVSSQQKIFNTAVWYDYILGFLIAAVLAFIGSTIVNRIGFFTIFLAPVAGIVIAEAVRIVIRKRRSKRLFQLVAAGVVVGSVLFLAWSFTAFYLLSLLWQGIYIVAATSTVYARLAGIQMR